MPTRRAVVTETSMYILEFEVPEGATEDEIEDAAHDAWCADGTFYADDYECNIEVQGETQ